MDAPARLGRRVGAALLAATAATAVTACGASPTPTAVIDASGLRFVPPRLELGVGTDVVLGASMVGHSFQVVGTELRAESRGTVATSTLAAGSYRFICDVPGHEAAGMVGVLEVVEP